MTPHLAYLQLFTEEKKKKNGEEDARIPVFETLLPFLCPWGVNLLLILFRASLSPLEHSRIEQEEKKVLVILARNRCFFLSRKLGAYLML